MERLILFIFTLTGLPAHSQTYYEFTTQQNRAKHNQYLKQDVIEQSLRRPLSGTTENEWMKAFWAMELLLHKTSYTKQKLAQAWKQAGSLSENFQKALLEATYTLFPRLFAKEVNSLLKSTTSPAIFIRCAEYLLVSKQTNSTEIEIHLKQKFAKSDFPGFDILKQRLVKKQVQKMPLVRDLLGRDFLPGHTVIYSLQRSNRDYAGMVLIRKPDGSFVKTKEGKLFYTAQLARAITDYPFYITNGNTPQGIFRWTGLDTSTISYIGPTPNLQMVMPYESPPQIFLNNDIETPAGWTRQLYASLLPQSWKEYGGIYESFLAGAVGRSEIIMHGTTIDPDYYKTKTYYPQTPSLGCLCSYEKWDKKGKLVISNQQKIVEALNSISSKAGYVVVIDLDDKKSAVTFKEVAAALR
jgi:hypothetical protein